MKNPKETLAANGRNKGQRIRCTAAQTGTEAKTRNIITAADSLYENRPELAKEWLPTLNGSLTPDDVTVGSNKKAWWRCKLGHEWQSTICNRAKGKNCPFCANKKVLAGFNDLATKDPQLASEWHPTLNGDFSPCDVTFGSTKKIWWLCHICQHEWQRSVNGRSSGYGCPECGKAKQINTLIKNRIRQTGSLADNNPVLAAQWHPAKNGELTPHDLTAGSGYKAFWMCPVCKNEWEATVSSRNRGNGCPECGKKRKGESKIASIIEKTGSLADNNSKLKIQWHPTLNDGLTPADVTEGSHKKVWWQCELGHEWQESIKNRSSKDIGCPVCSNKKVLKGYNDLGTVNPALSKEWHPTLNGDLSPSDVVEGSHKKAWWQCGLGHVWETAIYHRSISNTGCPYCANKKVLVGFNDLATTNPDLAAGWHPTKNGKLKPTDVTAGNNNKVWWQKEGCGHEWYTAINNRSSETGCPKCFEENQTSFPEQCIFYYFNKYIKCENRAKVHGVELDVYMPSIRAGIEYDGYRYHKEDNNNQETRKRNKLAKKGVIVYHVQEFPEYRADNIERGIISCVHDHNYHYMEKVIKTLSEWILGKKIHVDIDRDSISIYEQYIQIQRQNSVAANFQPELLKMWNYERNGKLLPEYIAHKSGKCVWWNCSFCGLEWRTSPLQMSNRKGNFCKCGRFQQTIKTRTENIIAKNGSFADAFPELAKEWHPTKNGELTADMITVSSNKRIWWICKLGHVWQAQASRRAGINGTGCPYCSNNKLMTGFNDLATKHPELASQWHPTKNGERTPNNVLAGSAKKAWWMCELGHEWETQINNRSKENGTGCPYCMNKKVLAGFNDLFTKNKRLASEWHPTLNGDLLPCDVTAGSNRKAWWQCNACNNEWQASICSRNKGHGCPYCSGRKKAQPGRL